MYQGYSQGQFWWYTIYARFLYAIEVILKCMHYVFEWQKNVWSGIGSVLVWCVTY